ncbi:class I SAM-dependent methyltransferase [Streptomyces sp. H27-D2]|uniref:class I SAM-dependent methyltransferase n=1 Tax=Streptomyces sp. H27-D2 TaxID=3046304 RepID=UPI002DBF4D0D|nr:class I SAM-dependent methyltransferase [Streptomyces sp. H27-D2]MEC4016936.1 class I SAM-dependent methyltransferase [Streptomyces sp. H27-D2]
MNASPRYLEAWEGFWRDASPGTGEVFWDVEPELAAAAHLPLFAPHFDAGLPLVDLGCGNGTQTRFLAVSYERVIGADLSPTAVERARTADPDGRADYRRLNASDWAAEQALHAELGDSDVYMRGVLHQCEPDDRPAIAEGIATLLGVRGRAFVVEPAEAAKSVLLGLAQGPAGPPPKLAAVFAHGIAPAEAADSMVPALLRAAGLEVLASGELPLTTSEYGPDGVRIVLPSKWLVAGRPG